jgi:hypothetical protein
MDKQRFLAVIEFRHGPGCSIGQPYGECSHECGFKVIKKVSDSPLTREQLAGYGVKPEEVRF